MIKTGVLLTYILFYCHHILGATVSQIPLQIKNFDDRYVFDGAGLYRLISRSSLKVASLNSTAQGTSIVSKYYTMEYSG